MSTPQLYLASGSPRRQELLTQLGYRFERVIVDVENALKIALISDTHGLLRPEAVEVLAEANLILHAGDVGTEEVLWSLKDIAPTYAVRGNVDKGEWAEQLPMDEVVETAGKTIYLIHILDDIDLDPAAAGFDMVLFGHSHKPEIFQKEGVLYVNPGSAGRRRFSLPVTMGMLEISGDKMEANYFNLID